MAASGYGYIPESCVEAKCLNHDLSHNPRSDDTDSVLYQLQIRRNVFTEDRFNKKRKTTLVILFLLLQDYNSGLASAAGSLPIRLYIKEACTLQWLKR